MISRSELLARAVEQSSTLLLRYLPGFDDSNCTRQAPALPNHVAWTLGHLALTMHRVSDKLDGKGIPETDFAPEGSIAGRDRFARESVAFGSSPVGDPAQYPAMARCRAIFDVAINRLAECLKSAPDVKLDEVTPWGNASTSLSDLAIRMVFHNGAHQGQIADLRRALGMPRVLG